MNNKFLFTAIGLTFFQTITMAQLFPKTDYPQGYFRDPLDIPISLAGNFGELRPGHYHMGMDIKTDAREGLPVHAAADGYIARIKIEPAGFGQAIYINHPNGYTTVYAHLSAFFPALAAYIKKQQYKMESWRVFLDIPKDLFPVKKGDLIAYSGNTGGSEGPHLHFEVRHTAEDVNRNPLLFGFAIPDNIKPSIFRLAVYDCHKSTYEQSPKLIPVKKSGADYVTMPGIVTVASDKISFGISAEDTHNGSSSRLGIYEAILYVDDVPKSGFRIDNISYDDTRYMNANIDYRTKETGGPYMQHLTRLPGYVNSIYAKGKDGIVDISDGQVHAIKIVVKDAAGNISTLQTQVRYNGAQVVGEDTNHGVRMSENSNTPVGVLTNRNKMFYPLMLDVFESSDCEFYIGEKCLYDSVHIRYAAAATSNPAVISRVHTIGDTYIPLQDSIVVRIKPTTTVTEDKRQRIVMQRFAGSKKDVEKVTWQGEWATAKFRDFGNFQLVLDETPPEVVPIGFANGSNLSRASRIAFTIKDNLGAFKHVRAELDGNWLRFTNDKGHTFIYVFDELCPPGEHKLVITAEDEAGNKAEKTLRFTR